MSGNLLGNFENHRRLSQTIVATFWETFGKTWPFLIPTSGHTAKNKHHL